MPCLYFQVAVQTEAGMLNGLLEVSCSIPQRELTVKETCPVNLWSLLQLVFIKTSLLQFSLPQRKPTVLLQFIKIGRL